MEKKLFKYTGAVKIFGNVVKNFWEAETIAVSEKKAYSNLSYRYKMESGRNVESRNIIFSGILQDCGNWRRL